MGIYVASDLHGEYEYFLEMLNLIKFSKEDKLYILGDVIDRGNGGLKIIDYIRENKNITLLRGNHEDLLASYLEGEGKMHSIMKKLWLKSGGGSTLEELKEKDDEYINELALYLETLPYYIVLGEYILAHAGVCVEGEVNSLQEVISNSTEEHFLWGRGFVSGNSRVKDYTVVCGHTPVQEFDTNTNKFFKREGLIVIDCGCGSGYKPGCLRLDDLKEFYID